MKIICAFLNVYPHSGGIYYIMQSKNFRNATVVLTKENHDAIVACVKCLNECYEYIYQFFKLSNHSKYPRRITKIRLYLKYYICYLFITRITFAAVKRLKKNRIIINYLLFIYYVEFCHSTRNASRIRQKVGNGVSYH